MLNRFRWIGKLLLAAGLISGLAAQSARAEDVQGLPVEGELGVQRSVTDIMITMAAVGSGPGRPVRLLPEHEGPDREELPQNPDAPGVSSMPELPPGYSPNSSGIGVFSPQTIGTNFTGATVLGVNPTLATPPDCMGAVGPTQYIVLVNGRLVTFNKTTGLGDGVLNADSDVFFAPVLTAGAFTTDPMIRYDRLSGRWILMMVDVPASQTQNRVMFAVSDAASAGTISGGTVWTFFFFNAITTAPAISSTCFADYPSMGVDANAVYIGTDNFCPSTFTSTDGFVVRKSSILGVGPIVVTAFRGLVATAAGAGPFAPRGVDNYDPAATEGYFIGPDNATFSTLMMRRVGTPGGTPTISANISITVPTTQFPLKVQHLGNTGGNNGRLDALDDRLFVAHIRNGRLWTAHNISVNNTGAATGTRTRNASRWYELNVPVGAGTPTIVQSGTVFTATGNNLTTPQERGFWIPSIMVSGQGHAALGFSTAGTNARADAATVGRLSGDALGTTQTPVLTTASATAYNPSFDPGGSGGRRWGDYSYTSLDPIDDMTMWTVQEFCDATDSYGVRVTKLVAPPPAAPNTLADITAGQNPVNLTLTGLSVAGSGYFDPGANLPGVPAFSHLSASITNGAATGTPPTVTSATWVTPTTVNLVLNATSATANIGVEKYTITITNPDGQTAAAAVVHVVAPPQFTITASAGPGGSISPSGAVLVNSGADQTFSITAAACQHIVDVLVDGVSVGPVSSHTFMNVTANHTISASFAINTFTITASAGAGGSISPSGAVVVNCGSDQTFTIVGDACFVIDDVIVDGVSVGATGSYTFTNVQANHTISTTFVSPTYTITASAGAGGSISPNGAVAVNCGADQTFTITADPCSAVQDVLVDGVSVGAVGSYTFTTVTANHTISATFVGTSYTITATAGPGGSITPAGVTVVACGDDLTYTIEAADKCHSVLDVLVDGVSVGAVLTYSFTDVQANHTIDASFATGGPFTITASAGPGGSISPSGAVSAPCGSDQLFTITAAGGFAILDVLVDGSSVGAVGTFTFTDVQANHTIAASFKDIECPNVTVNMPNGGESLIIGVNSNLTWTAADNVGVTCVDLLLSRTGVAGPYAALATCIPNSGSYSWMVTAPPTSHAVLKVVAHDAAGNSCEDVSDAEFEIINFVVPVLLSQFQANAIADGVELRWKMTDDATFARVGIERADAHAGPYVTLTSGIRLENGQSVLLDRSVIDGQTYYYRISGVTRSGQNVTFEPLVAIAGRPVSEFALPAVQPNPTHGVAQFAFAVPRESRVTLTVFDIQGRAVATVVDGIYSAGHYQATWSGESETGPAPSGVYFVHLVAPGQKLVQRFIMVH